ncbi:MAG: 50S ribosomal protein L31 [Candidatus Pacebacteria bacterium CG_4_10_14_0_8_um_filter_43_12]|nr:MAG: 50S ribosomal protein L31 [Candidatus Pacebacteria bacterium CG10_big_fil_rev_8_21_14_0_10_44_11]PIY79076.1 MAG: 50S ribosomal protein L31 [Candidatus Pacebacteria bacterium CG_4_10_14_0_8_um_filter_43_12]
MKQGVHPKWFEDCKVTCSCGNSFVIGSIQESMQIDICDKCHPFFTGEVKFVDRQGRVDRFLSKMKVAQAHQQKQTKQQSKLKKQSQDDQVDPKSYRELLRDQQSSLRKSTAQ